MRTVLIALVIGFVGQGVAVAYCPPAPCSVAMHYPVQIEMDDHCVAWNGAAWQQQVQSPNSFAQNCNGGVCNGGFLAMGHTYETVTPSAWIDDEAEGCYVITLKWEFTYAGSGTTSDCNGDQVCDCCVGTWFRGQNPYVEGFDLDECECP